MLFRSGKKAYTVFRVKRSLKCYLSAYQITKRLGSTIVKDYSVERLKLELFRFEKKGLTPIKEAWNNSIGQTNMEIELNPGVYILKGSFDFSNKLPCIVFNCYGERRLNFAELKVKIEKQITFEKIRESFRSLKNAYSTCGNKRKIIGAFLTCVSGHKLEWSSELINGEIGRAHV